jgi:hypothetical protein
MRKKAVLAVGGYESWLRAAGAEGCEDSLIQLRLASKYSFGCVPEYLIGYRTRRGNMSGDLVRMFDSAQRVYEQAEAIAPAWLKPLARRRTAEFLFLMGYNMLKRGQVLNAIGAIGRAHAKHLGCGLVYSIETVPNKIKSFRSKRSLRKAWGNSALRRFAEYDPKEDRHSRIKYRTSRKFAWLAAREQYIGCPQFPDRLGGVDQ